MKKPLSERFNNEEYDFTPWLCDNLGKISSLIGKELVYENREVRLGDKELDILAKVKGESVYVPIENMYGSVNHDHFDRLTNTYMPRLNIGYFKNRKYKCSEAVLIAEYYSEDMFRDIVFYNNSTKDKKVWLILAWLDENNEVNFEVVINPNMKLTDIKSYDQFEGASDDWRKIMNMYYDIDDDLKLDPEIFKLRLSSSFYSAINRNPEYRIRYNVNSVKFFIIVNSCIRKHKISVDVVTENKLQHGYLINESIKQMISELNYDFDTYNPNKHFHNKLTFDLRTNNIKEIVFDKISNIVKAINIDELKNIK